MDGGHVGLKIVGRVLDVCPTLSDNVNYLKAVLLQLT